MCAAPGSKTEQLLLLLAGTHPSPSGMVVANDADPKRMSTLRQRYARAGHPALLLTCTRGEDLQRFIGEAVYVPLRFDVFVCHRGGNVFIYS